jgi:hypothetical protein
MKIVAAGLSLAIGGFADKRSLRRQASVTCSAVVAINASARRRAAVIALRSPLTSLLKNRGGT